MNKHFILLLLLNFACNFGFGQNNKTSNVSYLDKKYKSCSESKAIFRITSYQSADSSYYQKMNLVNNMIELEEFYSNKLPCGIWTKNGAHYDYSKEVNYEMIDLKDISPSKKQDSDTSTLHLEEGSNDKDLNSEKNTISENNNIDTKSINKQITTHLRYPFEAIERDIMGKVFLFLVIGEDGKAEDIRVIRTDGHLLSIEAVRVCKLINFPIIHDNLGQPVKSYYKLPIAFQLQ